MDVVISGQAGTLAYLEGANVRFVRAAALESEFEIGREGASYLFQGVNDAIFTRGVDREFALAKLERAWESDRALRLLLIALEIEEELELRVEASDCLEDILKHAEVLTFVANQMYSQALPRDADPLLLQDEARWPLLAKFTGELIGKQNAVLLHRGAWDNLPPSLFQDFDKSGFEEHAIRS